MSGHVRRGRREYVRRKVGMSGRKDMLGGRTIRTMHMSVNMQSEVIHSRGCQIIFG